MIKANWIGFAFFAAAAASTLIAYFLGAQEISVGFMGAAIGVLAPSPMNTK